MVYVDKIFCNHTGETAIEMWLVKICIHIKSKALASKLTKWVSTLGENLETNLGKSFKKCVLTMTLMAQGMVKKNFSDSEAKSD